MARNGRLLMLTAILLTLVSLLGVGAAQGLASGLPDPPDIAWAYPWAQDAVAPEASERRQRVEGAIQQVGDSSVVALLASPTSQRELVDAEAAFSSAADPFEGGQSSPEARVAFAVRDARTSAEGTALFATLLFGVGAAAGLISLLRLVLPAVTFGTCALLALGVGGGVSALVLGVDAHPVWVLVPCLLLLAGFWGLLVGTNLLPTANHPFVVKAEQSLRGLPVAKRRMHVLTRVLLGLALAAVAILASAASYAFAVPGGVYAAYVGTFALGLIGSAVPILAAARVAAGEAAQA